MKELKITLQIKNLLSLMSGFKSAECRHIQCGLKVSKPEWCPQHSVLARIKIIRITTFATEVYNLIDQVATKCLLISGKI